MPKTYQATLDGDRLIWDADRPEQNGHPLSVHVTIVQSAEEPAAAPGDEPQFFLPDDIDSKLLGDPPESEEERRRMVQEALDGLAGLNAFADIDDPVAWQREIRKDRPLPFRD